MLFKPYDTSICYSRSHANSTIRNSASYRDLLGTANSIVEMDEQIGHVEAYLGDLGKRCNTTLLGKSVSNLSLLGGSIEGGGAISESSSADVERFTETDNGR